MRVVVIGARGFVGSHLVDQLGHLNHVVPTARSQVDLSDPKSLRDGLCPGDVVINASGYANATDTTEEGEKRFQAANVDGVRNLAQVASDVGVAHLVHISSVAAMGRWHQEGVTEQMQKPVASPYSASKLEGERVLAEFTGDLPITILRPTSVFGEGRGLARTLCGVISRRIVPLPAGGGAKIPFTYMGNVAHAVELCLANPQCFGKTFIIGDEQSYRLREVVLALAKELDVEIKIIPVPIWSANMGVRLLERLATMRGSPPLLDRGRLDTMTNSVSYSIASFQRATEYQPPYS
ncbi:MAG: NAD-dependent epimerase/dehydratase family protein, partial [Deinococcota bacterium]|nr:NAD-dependent epimerase/dehydratase family protein [Deinococcota bacterium]